MNTSIRLKYKNKNKENQKEEKDSVINLYNINITQNSRNKNIISINGNSTHRLNESLKSTITTKKENTSKKGEKIRTENRIKYGPIKNSHKKKRMSKNNTKNMKSRTDLLKHLSKISRTKKNKNLTDSKSVNKEKNNVDDIINLIQNNNYLYEKISYLQLWWKTIYQIIKIQKYLRGFLYRIKLLKLLELKEKIVYGTIQLSNFIKKIAYKKIISSVKRKLLYNYYNKWNNLAMKKIILKKLKFNRKKNKSGKKRKNDRNKRTNKLKSGSLTKRDIHRSQKTEGILPEKMQTIEKSDKKLGLSPSHSINNELTLSSKKGFETSRINTEKNIRSIFGNKNNSMEKRSKKHINTNLVNIKSNKTLKSQKSSKKSNHLNQASYNFIKNNSHNQINNYKFSSTINPVTGKMSKKNTYAKKGKKVNKNRNKKLPSDLDKDMSKFKSYNSESNKNKLFTSTKSEVKKNSELEYISKHENRFHCPKQLFTLNKKKGKNSSFKIEKLDLSFDNKTVKNEESENNIRSRSLETRHKKKIKSFVENTNSNKKSKDDIYLDNNNNFIKKSETESNNLIKSSDKDKEKEKEKEKDKDKNGEKIIIKSKTKTLKKVKKKKNNQKNTFKKESKTKNKNKMILAHFNIWKCKYIKRKIINKLRGISIMNQFIKLFNSKKNGEFFFKNIQNLHKNQILKENFKIYRNIIFTKFILQKLKEKYIENKIINNKEDNNDFNTNQKKSKVNIIEISPDHTTKIDSKIRNNFIKNEIFKKLQKLLIIKQKLFEYSIKKKYFMKWKILTDQFNPNRRTGFQNYFSNIQEPNISNDIIEYNNNENRRTSSSCHKKTIKHQPNLEFSFNEENNKLYNKKIVNYINNNNNISVNKDDFLNKSQPKINNYHIFDDISINKEDFFNNTHSQINNYNNLVNYNNVNVNDFNTQQGYNKYPNLTTCSKFDEPNNINININLITKSPYCQGIYKKKKVNYKNSLNKNINNSCVLREVNKSNFELNNTMENNNEFMNNSMVMGRRRKNNANIYYPKKVSPNLVENESVYGVQKIFIHEHPEIYNHKDLNNNNNFPYQKINIRYQKMNYNNDLNIENKQMHFGGYEEPENEDMHN